MCQMFMIKKNGRMILMISKLKNNKLQVRKTVSLIHCSLDHNLQLTKEIRDIEDEKRRYKINK